MKRFTLIYSFLLAVALPLLIACTIDDVAGEDNSAQKGDNVTVRLRISQAGAAVTRARTHEWDDKYAQDEELMNVWTVVVTDNTGNVKHILACKPKAEDREIDPIETELTFEKGTYHFYSFANISPEYVKYLLGFSSKPTADNTFDDSYKPGDIISFDLANTTWAITETDAKAKTIGINGNCFNVDNDNGYLSAGIPMSNIQTMDIDEKTGLVDLIVVRMLAKIELWLYNDYEEDLEIKSITLTDITKNTNIDAANLKLFPLYTDGADGVFSGANKKDGYKHGDIHPNLTSPNATENLTIYPTPDGAASLTETSNTWTISATDNKYEESSGTPNKEKAVKISFYVNESEHPKGENWGKVDDGTTQQFNHYFLKIKIDKGENQEELRYALIDDNGTKDGEKWDYIARNDYRIIPIVLDDYKLDLIPYDFPAIGVYPASVKEEDGIYTINFHDYGHFHLVPQVTKYSNGETIPYIDKKNGKLTYWTLGGPTESTASQKLSGLTSVWGSWTDASKSKEKEYVNEDSNTYPEDFKSTAFYKTDYDPAAIKDGDDVGGEPVWYQNTNNENPTWSADANYSGPFIFGYINKHPEPVTGDRKVYHEFSINLYKEGMSTPRQMTYRLYMILDESQMMYPNSSRRHGVSAVRHTHGY